jgi:uncharacterized protein (DUF2235 family)
MAKSILIFSDGTGQGAGTRSKRSNIVKLHEATEHAAPRHVQDTFYDPGLGVRDDRTWWRWGHDLLSQATGLGISQNIKDCYGALIKRYEPGDRIYLFGFSRGAYTVRSLGGVLSLCGVPMHDSRGRSPRTDDSVRDALVGEATETIYKHYGNDAETKAERKALGEQYRARYGGNLPNSGDPPVPYFIGVFDTVRALGVPGSSGLVGWRHAFHDDTLNPRVPFARQALAIDENREVFKPELWDESGVDTATQSIKQVWFPGVHTDIGGGYPECGLSDLSLAWMVKEATDIPHPIIVDQAALGLSPNCLDMQHDERSGRGFFWVEGTRERFTTPTLHEDFVRQRYDAPTIPILDRNVQYLPEALRNSVYRDRYPPRD